MRYILIDQRRNDMFTEEFESKDQAIMAGESSWNSMSDYDQKHCEAFYVLESVNPDEDAPDHFDGNPVKEWK